MMANNIKLDELSFVESSEFAPVASEDGDNVDGDGVNKNNVDGGVGTFVVDVSVLVGVVSMSAVKTKETA